MCTACTPCMGRLKVEIVMQHPACTRQHGPPTLNCTNTGRQASCSNLLALRGEHPVDTLACCLCQPEVNSQNPMPGRRCCSCGALAATHLERLWQLLGHALGNLAQLAQRPVGLQAPQSTGQGPYRSLVLPIVLRGERDLQARGEAAVIRA